MYRALFVLLVLCGSIVSGWADETEIRFPSPNGRFALRIGAAGDGESNERKIELVEKETGKVVADLGLAYRRHLPETVLVWSADSKRAAYATRDDREGDTSVYFWDGSVFNAVDLPPDLPSPKINFGKAAGGGVKNYGGGVKPVRWLKSGELELSSDQMMLSRENDRSYTGVVVFTLAFDAKHHARVGKVGKTKTTVE